jgi:hypothetical protein
MTIVVKSEINPWHYPPSFDFQYGDWLRKKFESGNIEPWPSKEMPDLALLITQILLANKILLGPPSSLLLSNVPYRDFMMASKKALDNLMPDLHSDTRNVLLTYARIWTTAETNTIHSKPDAANWVIERLPEEYRPAMKRARAICIGDEIEYWDDVKIIIQPCVNYIVSQILKQISLIELSGYPDKIIKLAKK